MQVEPGRQVLAVQCQTMAVPWVVGTVKPVAGQRMHGRRCMFHGWPGHGAGDFGMPKAREIVRRGLCWGGGANH